MNHSYEKALLRHFLINMGYLALFVAVYFLLIPRLCDPKSTEHFTFQIGLSRLLLLTMFVHLIVVIFFSRNQAAVLLKEFIFGTGSPYTLAAVRFFIMFLMFNQYIGWAIPELSVWSELPASERQNLPFMGWFIQNIPISPEIYFSASVAGAILAAMSMFGLCTRWALLLHIPVVIYVFGVPNFFGKLNHHQIMVWFPAILAFSPCSDAWSLDSLIKRKITGTKAELTSQTAYALPLKFIWMLYAVIYFFSGLKKLWFSGLDWALSNSFINQILLQWVEFYDRVPGFRIDHYPVLAKAGGLGVVLFELYYPLLILVPLTRLIACCGGLSLHKLTNYFLYINFADLQQTYTSYINWDFLRKTKNKIYRKPLKIAFIIIILLLTSRIFQIQMFLALIEIIKIPVLVILGVLIVMGIFSMTKKKKANSVRRNLTAGFKNFILHLAIANSLNGSFKKGIPSIKPLMIVGFFLVLINATFGLFSINSWPFSSYPSYQTLREDKISSLKLEAFDSLGHKIPVDSMAKKEEFRKEDILPLEAQIMDKYFAGDTIEAKTQAINYWRLWELYVPSLPKADSVNVFIIESPLIPEKRNEIINEQFLFGFTVKR